MKLEAGQFVTFRYSPPARDVRKRPGLQTMQDVRPTSQDKHVLILNPSYHHKVHGIDLARITPAEQQTLRAILDPKVKAAVDRGEWPVEGAPPYLLVRDILKRMDPLEVIKNPVLAYQTLIKPFIRDKDCYRQYWDSYMYGARVLEATHVQGRVVNPRPLFKAEGTVVNGKPLFKKV